MLARAQWPAGPRWPLYWATRSTTQYHAPCWREDAPVVPMEAPLAPALGALPERWHAPCWCVDAPVIPRLAPLAFALGFTRNRAHSEQQLGNPYLSYVRDASRSVGTSGRPPARCLDIAEASATRVCVQPRYGVAPAGRPAS